MCYIKSMSAHKTTVELEKLFEQLQGDLLSSEISLGGILFNSSAADVGEQFLDEFSSLESQKEKLGQEITDIQNLQKERSQLNKELEAIKAQGNELSSGWTTLYEKLGEALSNSIDVSFSKEFEPFRQPVFELRQRITESQTALDSLRTQMEGQSFMNRLLSHVQYSAKNTSVSQLKKKLSHQYAKCGREVFATGVLEKLYEESLLNAETSAAYAMCSSLKREIDSNFLQMSGYNSKLAENEKQLEEKGVSGSVEKRVRTIEHEIKQKNDRQQILCQTIGHDFSLKYVAPDGEDLSSYAGLQNDISVLLERISNSRKQIVVCRRKLQIISLSDQISSTDKRLENLNRNIHENEEKISRLSAQNKELASQVDLVGREKEQLVAKRAELELLDLQATKRISV